MGKFAVGVPFSGVEKYIEGDPVIATREDEAIAIAFGAELTGKESLVFMQNSGLGNSLDVITSLLKPCGAEIELLISNRTEPEHHAFMGALTIPLMKEIGYQKVSYV